MGEELDDADIPDAYLDSLGYEALLQHAMQIANAVPGRNDECNCGSGKKYKKCCGGVHESDSDTHVTASIEITLLADEKQAQDGSDCGDHPDAGTSQGAGYDGEQWNNSERDTNTHDPGGTGPLL